MIIIIGMVVCIIVSLIFALYNQFYLKVKYGYLKIFGPLVFALIVLYSLFLQINY